MSRIRQTQSEVTLNLPQVRQDDKKKIYKNIRVRLREEFLCNREPLYVIGPDTGPFLFQVNHVKVDRAAVFVSTSHLSII